MSGEQAREASGRKNRWAHGPQADKVALRSAALRLSHAANEGLAALVSVIVQSARVDTLATMRPILEPKDSGPSNK